MASAVSKKHKVSLQKKTQPYYRETIPKMDIYVKRNYLLISWDALDSWMLVMEKGNPGWVPMSLRVDRVVRIASFMHQGLVLGKIFNQ